MSFRVIARCPADVAGALRGALRRLTFSELAQAEPYQFSTGHYVEQHVDDEELYTETDDRCVPVVEGAAITASHSTFGGFSLRRIVD